MSSEATSKSNPSDSSQEKVLKEDDNFTWAHFFHVHCGILLDDALMYEKPLIANRMNPLDCLLESLVLVVKYGRIPVGDRIKIEKTLQRKDHLAETAAAEMKKAKATFGLERYKDFEAQMILKLAGGTKPYEIDWGVEQYEEGMETIKGIASAQMIKDGTKEFNAGVEAGRKMTDRVYVMLTQYFSYTTFDYTKGKDVAAPSTAMNDSSISPLAISTGLERREVPENMYS